MVFPLLYLACSITITSYVVIIRGKGRFRVFDASWSRNIRTDFDETWNSWLRPGPLPTGQLYWRYVVLRGWSGHMHRLAYVFCHISRVFLLRSFVMRSGHISWPIVTISTLKRVRVSSQWWAWGLNNRHISDYT